MIDEKQLFPEYPLTERSKLAYDWITGKVDYLLDAGCAYGYATRFFKKKCKKAYGIDINPEFIRIAKKRYKDINFSVNPLDRTPFKSSFFDIIILGDVLEHVHNELKCLNELYRILRKGGSLTLTVPHKGLLSFMDAGNYAPFLRKRLPFIYNLFLKVRGIRHKGKPHLTFHRHYFEKDIRLLLNKSKFNNKYKVEKVFKSSLFVAIYFNLEYILSFLIGQEKTNKILTPLLPLRAIDYKIPYGPLSYNLAMKIVKTKN